MTNQESATPLSALVAADATPNVLHAHVPSKPHRQRVLIEYVGTVAGETEGRERQATVLGERLQYE